MRVPNFRKPHIIYELFQLIQGYPRLSKAFEGFRNLSQLFTFHCLGATPKPSPNQSDISTRQTSEISLTVGYMSTSAVEAYRGLLRAEGHDIKRLWNRRLYVTRLGMSRKILRASGMNQTQGRVAIEGSRVFQFKFTVC